VSDNYIVVLRYICILQFAILSSVCVTDGNYNRYLDEFYTVFLAGWIVDLTYVRVRVQTLNHDVGVQNGHEMICLKITKCSVVYILVTVYHPRKSIYDTRDFTARLTDDDIDFLTSTFPQTILFVCGDFNQLDLSSLLADTGLFCHIDTGPTRGRHTLDRFITNTLWLPRTQLIAAHRILSVQKFVCK